MPNMSAAEAFPYDIPRAGVDVIPLLDALDQFQLTELNSPEQHAAQAELFIDTMRAVGFALPKAGMQDTFNYVYWRLSKYCMHAVNQDNNTDQFVFPEFAMPGKVTNMMSIFGEEYLSQLRSYSEWVEGDDDKLDELVMPWLLTFFHPAITEGKSDGVKFLAGMMAHIKYDLPRAVKKGGIDEAYHPDFTVPVQTLIRQITQELAPALVPIPGPNALRRAFCSPIVGYIGSIREVAWDDAIQLQQAALLDTHTQQQVESLGMAWPADVTGYEATKVRSLEISAAASINRLLNFAGAFEIGSRVIHNTMSLVPGLRSWKRYDQDDRAA